MDIWVMEYRSFNDNDFYVSLYMSELDARKAACNIIEDDISNNWDADDETQKDFSDNIEEQIGQKNYAAAMRCYNEYQDDYNSDHATIYSVYAREVNGSVKTSEQPAFVPTKNGSTCRKCNDYNEYAMPDCAAGTHLCRSCKTFTQIFGAT